MEMKTTKELLQLLLKEVSGKNFDRGLCFTIIDMRNLDIITFDELLLLKTYLKNNEPVTLYNLFNQKLYWWKPCKAKPRIKWLTKQIKKLEKLELLT